MEMNGIEIKRTNGGLIKEGVKPNELADANAGFSRLLNEAVKREKSPAAPTVAGAQAASTAVGVPGVGIISPNPHIDKTDELYEQCQALEGFLVKNILNSMRKNVMKSNLVDTGYAGEIYEDMLWDEYAKEYTKNAGFGLADLAYLELTGQRGRKP
jgi:flagellar protein FlgJ